MNLSPSKSLTEREIKTGLKLVVADGMMAEAMVVFTSGTFLTAMAINMGATNFQLGLFAALPTFTTIFQLLSVWFVQRFNNRRVITVLFNFLARLPIIAIGLIPFIFTGSTSIQVLILLLFFQHVFGDIAGPSWASWIKDLVPAEQLGAFFSRRGRMAQTLNVTLSMATAFCIDYVKVHYPADEIMAYNVMFLIGGAFGLISVGLLLRTPEPSSKKIDDKLLTLFAMPLKNVNFKNLLVFNSFWAFALNLATPFFAVYLLKTIGLPLSYVIALGIIGQLSGIFSYKLWGRYADRFSNKNIIGICAPMYVGCILLFAFVDVPGKMAVTICLLLIIYTISGLSIAGINLALYNIGLKLASKNEAIAYLSVKNMFVAFFSTLAPLIGGLMADFFSKHQFTSSIAFKSVQSTTSITLLNLQGWNYFFIIGGLLALVSLKFLGKVKEDGEVKKSRVVNQMRVRLRRRLRKNLGKEVAGGIYDPSGSLKRHIEIMLQHRLMKAQLKRALQSNRLEK